MGSNIEPFSTYVGSVQIIKGARTPWRSRRSPCTAVWKGKARGRHGRPVCPAHPCGVAVVC